MARRNMSVGLRLGLLGGTFDPIHLVHLFMGEVAADELKLDKVIYMPAGMPPHKIRDPITAPAHRLSMTRAALQEAPRFEVSDLELYRNTPSYTIDTVKSLLADAERGTELYLIIGSDSLLELHTWKDQEELLSLVRLAVYPRPGHAPDATSIPGRDRVTFLHADDLAFNLSSTTIRDRVREGRSIRYLVPRPVEQYIRQNGLYG